jgi:hypothetical protein
LIECWLAIALPRPRWNAAPRQVSDAGGYRPFPHRVGSPPITTSSPCGPRYVSSITRRRGEPELIGQAPVPIIGVGTILKLARRQLRPLIWRSEPHPRRPFPAPWHTDLPKSADRGAGAAVSGEPFDLADANRREPTIGSGTGPFSRAPLPLSAAPPASTSPRYGTSRIRKHDTGSFHHFRRSAPAASSSCMLGTSANEQLTWRPRFTDVAASDRRCRCRSAHPSRTRSLNAGPLVH